MLKDLSAMESGMQSKKLVIIILENISLKRGSFLQILFCVVIDGKINCKKWKFLVPYLMFCMRTSK